MIICKKTHYYYRTLQKSPKPFQDIRILSLPLGLPNINVLQDNINFVNQFNYNLTLPDINNISNILEKEVIYDGKYYFDRYRYSNYHFDDIMVDFMKEHYLDYDGYISPIGLPSIIGGVKYMHEEICLFNRDDINLMDFIELTSENQLGGKKYTKKNKKLKDEIIVKNNKKTIKNGGTDIGITKEEAYAFVRTHRGEDERSDEIVYNYLNKPNNNPLRYYLPGETINDKIIRESIEENENAKKIGELVKEADRDKELFLAGKKKLDYYIYIPEDQLSKKI